MLALECALVSRVADLPNEVPVLAARSLHARIACNILSGTKPLQPHLPQAKLAVDVKTMTSALGATAVSPKTAEAPGNTGLDKNRCRALCWLLRQYPKALDLCLQQLVELADVSIKVLKGLLGEHTIPSWACLACQLAYQQLVLEKPCLIVVVQKAKKPGVSLTAGRQVQQWRCRCSHHVSLGSLQQAAQGLALA